MNPTYLLKTRKQVQIKAVVLTAVLLIACSDIMAQKICDLSFCIQKGLEKNFAIQVIRNQEEIASNNHSPGNAGMLPSIAMQNQYAGSVNTYYQDPVDDAERILRGVHNSYGSAGINLEITIFKGFQVKRTYEKLGVQYELEGLNTQMSVENLVAQIVAEYTNYIQQIAQSANLAYAVSLSRERVRIDEQRYLLGGASKLELLQSIVYLNADSSRYARQKEVLHSAQIRLNQLMASDDLGEDIMPGDTFIRINHDLVYDELLEQTLQFNTSIQIAKKNQVISEIDYRIIKSHAYPYVNLASEYQYGYNRYGTGEISDQHMHGMNYEIRMGINLFDGLNQQREKKNSRIDIENRNIRYAEIEQGVRADLLSIYYAYENNLRLLRLEEQNLDVARENLAIALERYKLGSLSGIELREVQKSLLDAEERLISVKYQAKLAEISLLQISGKIMDYL